MGRKPKVVRTDDELDRRELGYYSTPDFVARFFAERISELRPDARRVFDPCIGRGEFTQPFKARGYHVSGSDIIDMSPAGCDLFLKADFLETLIHRDDFPLFATTAGNEVDVIVANPPYNCHEVDYIRDNKPRLIKRFGKAASLNMYSLFIRAIIDYAPGGGFIGLVTHDSFLTAVGHQDLRRYIADTCTIHNLHLCPTDLFSNQGADVRTCLLILEKRGRVQPLVQVSNRPGTATTFKTILEHRRFQQHGISELILGDVRDNCEFTIGVPREIHRLFKERRLSEIAPCITGISTGNDKKYLSPARSAQYNMPFYKNPASRRFFAEPDGFLCSDYKEVARVVPNFMIRNRDIMFQGGLSCSSMGVKFGATVRPEGTACGVNPNIIVDGDTKWWLLSFLNSSLCFYMVRAVIIRGNMITAGYASRIPVPEIGRQALTRLMELGRDGHARAAAGRAINEICAEIDRTVANELGLSSALRKLLADFNKDPIRLA